MIIKKQKIYKTRVLKEVKFAFLPVKLHEYLESSEVKNFDCDIIWLEKYVKYTILTPLSNYGENKIGMQTRSGSIQSISITSAGSGYQQAVNNNEPDEFIMTRRYFKVLRYEDAILEELISCS
jgi:hypothetical protein